MLLTHLTIASHTCRHTPEEIEVVKQISGAKYSSQQMCAEQEKWYTKELKQNIVPLSLKY